MSCSILASLLIPQQPAIILFPYCITKWPISERDAQRLIWSSKLSQRYALVLAIFKLFWWNNQQESKRVFTPLRIDERENTVNSKKVLFVDNTILKKQAPSVPPIVELSCFILLIGVGYRNQYVSKWESLESSAWVWTLHMSEVSQS